MVKDMQGKPYEERLSVLPIYRSDLKDTDTNKKNGKNNFTMNIKATPK